MIAYHDVYTSAGNSGSYVQSKDLVDGKVINVCVHTAFSPYKQLNICTVVTPELEKWRNETLAKRELNEYRFKL